MPGRKGLDGGWNDGLAGRGHSTNKIREMEHLLGMRAVHSTRYQQALSGAGRVEKPIAEGT